MMPGEPFVVPPGFVVPEVCNKKLIKLGLGCGTTVIVLH
jgi:hypothetical protein